MSTAYYTVTILDGPDVDFDHTLDLTDDLPELQRLERSGGDLFINPHEAAITESQWRAISRRLFPHRALCVIACVGKWERDYHCLFLHHGRLQKEDVVLSCEEDQRQFRPAQPCPF